MEILSNWFSLLLLLILIPLANSILGKLLTNKNFPPSPFSLPVIGHLHLIKSPIHRTLDQLSKKYGNIFFLQFGSRKVLVITSAAAVEECFTKNDIIFANRPQLLAGKHLNYNFRTIGLAPYGPQWRNLRRLAVVELFSASRLSTFASIREEEVRLMVKQLYQDSCEKQVKVKLSSKFLEVAFNVMMRVVAGKRYYGKDVVDKEANEFKNIMREFAEIHGSMNLNDLLPVLQWIDFQGVEKKMKEVMNKMDIFLQHLVDEHREIRTKSQFDKSSAGNDKPKMTLIDVMLSLQEEEPELYTDLDIKAVILTILVAGSETSSTTMEWAMSLLLNHQEKMKKVVAEIDANVGLDHLLDEADLSKLNYLQNVITETLRLYPTLPVLLPHESSESCTVGGYDVPQGTILMVNLWTIHRDPKLWLEPKAFRPERFVNEESVEGFKLIPFGVGRRACPGASLARRVIGLTLGSLIQTFEWDRISDEEINMKEGTALSLPKSEPLEALCNPRQATINLLSTL